MIPALGAEQAMDLHKRMSQHRVAHVREFSKSRNDVSYSIHIANGTLEEASHWLGPNQFFLQQGDDLGQRMEYAVRQGFEGGAARVMVVGTDCPALSESEFTKTLLELDDHDVVYVPAVDGGYVMVGFSGEYYQVFSGIVWGADTVMKESLDRARATKLNYKLLDPLADVDRIEDVENAELAMRESDIDHSHYTTKNT